MNSILMADQKVRAVHMCLGDQFETHIKSTVAYADGTRDLPLLEMVKTPVAVHPEPKLAQVAKEKGWEIIP